MFLSIMGLALGMAFPAVLYAQCPDRGDTLAAFSGCLAPAPQGNGVVLIKADHAPHPRLIASAAALQESRSLAPGATSPYAMLAYNSMMATGYMYAAHSSTLGRGAFYLYSPMILP